MDYKEVWNSKKPEEIGIQENEMWELSGKSLLEALITDGFHVDIGQVIEIEGVKIKATSSQTIVIIPDDV